MRNRSMAMRATDAEADAEAGADGSRARIPIQPVPVEVLYTHTRNAAGPTTSWVRSWRDMEDVGRCHLCPPESCLARRDGKPRCIVGVPAFIPLESLATFDLTAWIAGSGTPLEAGAGLGPGVQGQGSAG